MALTTLEDIAAYLVSDGKGFLAADESTGTIGKRFDAINTESTEDSRRDYRELLFRAEGMQDNIGGVILFDETLRQNAEDGTPLKDLINSTGALPGIKVDKGISPFNDSEEVITGGLEDLNERCAEYAALGAKFTKWRAVIKIGNGIPTQECIDANMKALADYAKIVQNNNMVPMVEPEVLMDGDHSVQSCFEATAKCLKTLFSMLNANDVSLKGTILKPNMVVSGTEAPIQASVSEVAELTLKVLKENVPSDLAGIAFLSGGQSDLLATEHLDAMNKLGKLPWPLSFSYGRALQQPALKAWMGQSDNKEAAQKAFSHRALMNKLASKGEWQNELET
ncbi:fructose-bisphosphate aldolase class I [SAR86 cluster bacterium]|jgi:fructose-bisphosphate aldolase class I|nr:fructose-bisphosphate aldolase class I [SAR86 cluster bacterium]|tara:strand:- start:201 stop:1211 length:1011 start_codon:yes stop_codon:yes gene_type:complete